MTDIAWLAISAEVAMRAEAGRHPTAETGGMLLGYWSADAVVITGVIGPGPAALRTGTSFHPDALWQEGELARRYAASGRRHTYVGDWHVHPKGTVALSRTDRRTLAGIAHHDAARVEHPVFAVLAPDAQGAVAIWQFRRRWLPPLRLAVGTFDAEAELS